MIFKIDIILSNNLLGFHYINSMSRLGLLYCHIVCINIEKFFIIHNHSLEHFQVPCAESAL